MDKVHYDVSGIINADRKTKIKKSLDKIKGVQKVEVDVARGTVEVNFNTPATSEVIENGIEKQGCIILN
jgi:copper chaperone CopZ